MVMVVGVMVVVIASSVFDALQLFFTIIVIAVVHRREQCLRQRVRNRLWQVALQFLLHMIHARLFPLMIRHRVLQQVVQVVVRNDVHVAEVGDGGSSPFRQLLVERVLNGLLPLHLLLQQHLVLHARIVHALGEELRNNVLHLELVQCGSLLMELLEVVGNHPLHRLLALGHGVGVVKVVGRQKTQMVLQGSIGYPLVQVR
mmetsp:Transcript_45164/g.74888  ORF Transcript_45164/g.74888 Transcript_45164/m.74888 type:complete len:201 (-) Transcript_45164:582-1184(-)